MILAVPVAACIQLVVITLVPKLRHEIDMSANPREPVDTVASISEETKVEQERAESLREMERLNEAVEQMRLMPNSHQCAARRR